MITPARATALLQPILVMCAGLFVIVVIYGIMTNVEYEDDDFTVTIVYDCNRVLTERNYPGEVLQECLDLRDEIKRRNN